MNKKLMSSVLAGAMAVSALGVSASAATSTEKSVSAAGSTTFKVSATVAEAIIDVTIPSTMSAVVNPYGISVTTKTGVYGATGFTSPVYTIKNNTLTSAVMVSATPTITVPTTTVDKVKVPTIAVLDDAAKIADQETAKEKAIYAYVAGVESATNVAVDAAAPALTIFDAAGALDGGATVATFEDATTDEKGAVHTKYDLILIPKAEADANDATKVAKYGYGQIQMGGDVTNTNITPWTKSDKITVNLVLDIAPCKDDAVKGTYGSTDGGSAGFTAAVAADDIAFASDSAFALGNLVADNTYELVIDSNSYTAAQKPTFAGYTITGATVSSGSGTVVNVTTTGLNAFKLDVQATGDAVVTYDLTNDGDSSTTSITFNITVS